MAALVVLPKSLEYLKEQGDIGVVVLYVDQDYAAQQEAYSLLAVWRSLAAIEPPRLACIIWEAMGQMGEFRRVSLCERRLHPAGHYLAEQSWFKDEKSQKIIFIGEIEDSMSNFDSSAIIVELAVSDGWLVPLFVLPLSDLDT